MNHPPRLYPTDGPTVTPVAGKDELGVLPTVFKQQRERINCLRMERHRFPFLRLPLREGKPLFELPRAAVVHIAPPEPKQVAYTESDMTSQDDHGVITVLATKQKVSCKGTKVVLIPYRFCCGHGVIPLLQSSLLLQKGDFLLGNLFWNQFLLYHGNRPESRLSRIVFR